MERRFTIPKPVTELVSLGLVSASLLIPACAHPPEVKSKSSSFIVPILTDNVDIELPSYPEIAHYIPRGNGEFNSLRAKNYWDNRSTRVFNPESAKLMYNYLENLSIKLKPPPYKIFGQTVNYTIQPRSITERMIYIISQDADPPSWASDPVKYGFTRVLGFSPGQEIKAITIVRDYPNLPQVTNDNISAVRSLDSNSTFVIEACQSSLWIPHSDDLIRRELQEITCNSLGTLYFMKRHGYNFELYNRFISQVPLITRYGPMPHVAFSQEIFKEMPDVEVLRD